MTTVDKALAALAQRTQPTFTPGQTAAEALSGLPLAKKRKRSEPRPPAMKEPTDPAAHLDTPPWEETPRPEDPPVVRKVLEHDNTGEARLTLRELDSGEFASIEQARRHPEEVTTDYVENRGPASKAPAKKAAKKAAKKSAAKKAATKAAAKKAPAKKATKKTASKTAGKKASKK